MATKQKDLRLTPEQFREILFLLQTHHQIDDLNDQIKKITQQIETIKKNPQHTSQFQIAKKFNVHPTTISAIKCGRLHLLHKKPSKSTYNQLKEENERLKEQLNRCVEK